MKLFSIAITACLTIGCVTPYSSPPVLSMAVDKNFTPAEQGCIADSASKWAEQTSGLAHIDLQWDALDSKDPRSVAEHRKEHRLVRWTSDLDVVKAIDGDGSSGWLMGQVSGREIGKPYISNPIQMALVADRLEDPHVCKLTAIHEFGHVLGLPHIDGPQNIMFWAVVGARTACLKKDDLLMFCYINDCSTVPMKPCDDQPELGVTLPEEEEIRTL